MILSKANTPLNHINSITHDGKVIVFATADDGTVYYTVRADGFERKRSGDQLEHWGAWQALPLPNEETDPSVVTFEEANFADSQGNPILRSRYQTRDAGERVLAGPVRLISGLGYLYVFRVSAEGHLWMDRFVLDGMNNQLIRKLEVRYKRSRQKYAPLEAPSGRNNVRFDSLDFRDADGGPFFEPTIELNLQIKISYGWFSVVLLPTDKQEEHRWHFFFYHENNGLVNASVRASSEGLFDLRDRPGQYGLELRHFQLQSADNTPLAISGAPVAARYDKQEERANQVGETNLVRTDTRVMLVVPTNRGAAALDFAVTADGRLSHLSANPESLEPVLLRGTERTLQLPPDTLERIQAFRGERAPATGRILGMEKTEDGRIRLLTGLGDPPPKAEQIRIKNTQSYDGLYTVTNARKDSFEIEVELTPSDASELLRNHAVGELDRAVKKGHRTLRVKTSLREAIPEGAVLEVRNGSASTTFKVRKETSAGTETIWIEDSETTLPEGAVVYLKEGARIVPVKYELGEWEEAPPASNALTEEGQITALHPTENGNLRLGGQHELHVGDQIQIQSASGIDGWHDVRHTDEAGIVLNAAWRGGKVTNQSRRTFRGIQMEGKGERFDIQLRQKQTVGCLELRFKTSEKEGLQLSLHGEMVDDRGLSQYEMSIQLEIKNGAPFVHLRLYDGQQTRFSIVQNTPDLADGRWHHLAYTWESDTGRHSLYLDGKGDAIEYPFSRQRHFRCASIETDIYSPDEHLKFKGQLAELRLWNRPRTQREIQANLYAPLTGREAGLAGYWPMGAVVDGRQLLDLTEHENHAIITGHIYVPGAQLERDDAVIEFRNETLIAVTQSEAYTESVEFKPHGHAADETDFFEFRYRGKRSRNAETWTAHEKFSATQHAYEALDDGWFRVSCSFVVPEGAALLRSFGIRPLGEWDWLEVRNHKLQLSADSITRQTYSDHVNLSVLGADFDDGGQILSQIATLTGEREELKKEVVDLNEELTLLSNSKTINDERERRRLKVDNLIEDQIQLSADFRRAKENIFNYWLELIVDRSKMGENDMKMMLSAEDRPLLRSFFDGPRVDPSQHKFRFILVKGYSNKFHIRCKYKDLLLANDGSVFYGAKLDDNPDGRNSIFVLEEVDLAKRLYRIRTIGGSFISPFGPKGVWGPHSSENHATTFEIRKTEETCNTKTDEAEKALASVNARLKEARKKLTYWNEHYAASKWTNEQIGNKKSEISDRLKGIEDRIGAINVKLATLRKRFKSIVAREAAGIPMSELPGREESLRTKGNLLGFIQTKSTLHLLTSADGNLYLSYFDRYGQLRQPHYDTVSDTQNTTFEAWKPDTNRLCLNVSQGDIGMRIRKGIPLIDEWTIECRFFFPFPEKTEDQTVHWFPGDWVSNVLIGNGRECSVMTRTINGGPMELGVYYQNDSDYKSYWGLFFPCGFDMNTLSNGWHHLTVIGKGYGPNSNTIFYIDGEEVGDIRKAAADYLKRAERGENPDGIIPPLLGGPGVTNKDRETGPAKARIETLKVTGKIRSSVDAMGVIWGDSFGRPNSFAGKLAEVRIWQTALSPEEVNINAKLPGLQGHEPGLLAYFPLNGDSLDKTGNGYDAEMVNPGPDGSAHFVPFTGSVNRFSVNGRTPRSIISNEYSTVSIDPRTKQKTALLRRFMAYPEKGGVQLLSQQRIEELELRWIGNAQINPTLLGFIEGAPPVPSENLTEDPPAYQGATAVELVTEEDLSLSWNREDASSLGLDLDLFVGAAASVSILGLGGVSYKVGVAGGLSLANTSFNQSIIGSSAGSTQTDRLELRGHPEKEAHFPHLGPRFVPKNIGYALVVSGTADVYITRLRRSKRMIAYTVQPSADIPLDVNTITFLINPAYTMNGSLDGLTGTRPTSERFFEHVVDMRAQYGSAFPASYYRVREAYDLKEMIEKQDQERAAYFANFNVLDLSGNIDRAVGASPEDDKETERIAKEKQEELEKRIEDEEARAHALSAFAAWQRKMERLQIKAGKRNIVNTYVWDADGGLRVEEQQFAGTIEHTVGGSFDLSGALGVSGEAEASGLGIGIGVGLNLQATLSMSQTMSKTEASSRALSLSVDLSGVESQGITDFKDNPLLPGEKVDRYRFMSFYLEGSSKHFLNFFSEVVDPEWLAGNDEEARALRQAQAAQPNKVWRVLHRVTYVERPALKGFGKK